ncbi:proteinase-activated receptor 1-like [Labeo rohita]|uniref:proteinase-activated receptor 1-like n=1 Tax=Labeo rohita TaxID=84645 RepID=UPI0021E1E6D6|nr:proteinase-activated receptor 1-like [Labeo rohita]
MNLGSVEVGGSGEVIIYKSEPLITEETEHSEKSSVSSFEQTDELTDDSKSSTEMSEELGSAAPGPTLTVFLGLSEQSPATNKSSTPDAVPYKSKGASISDTLNILDESVDFLKILLVTRIMPLFYIIIILISLPLNALALVTFACRIQEKKPAVIYMAHLACVDLLFTLLLPLKIHYQMNASDWVFDEAACRVLTAAYYCYMYCSILLMMCMSVDRLLAVVFPVAFLTWRTTRKATFICTLVWLLALAGTVPLLSMRQTFRFQNLGVTCFDLFDENTSETLYLSVFLILPCIFYFLPLVVILVSYSTIIYVLCAKRDHSVTSSSSSDNRRRAAIMVTAVLTEFVVCFAPSNGILLYHCVHLAMGSDGSDTYSSYLMAVCLGSSSVFLDPLLYCYVSSQYRQQIRSVFLGCKAKRADITSNTTQNTYTNPI